MQHCFCSEPHADCSAWSVVLTRFDSIQPAGSPCCWRSSAMQCILCTFDAVGCMRLATPRLPCQSLTSRCGQASWIDAHESPAAQQDQSQPYMSQPVSCLLQHP